MALAWFLSHYETQEIRGRVRRRVALDDATSEIEAAGGYWSETEVNGDRALVLCRAPARKLNALAHHFQRIEDPSPLWTDTRREPAGPRVFASRPLDDVFADVLDDGQIRVLKRRVERLIEQADRDGYVRLDGGWTHRNRLLLAMLGRRGYGLDRVSTGTFPTTGILDNFNRGTGIGANWTADPISYGAGALTISSSTLLAGTVAGSDNQAYWNAAVFGPDVEVYMTIVTKPETGAPVGIGLRCSPSGDDQFEFGWSTQSGTDTGQIKRVDTKVDTQLGASISQEWANGEKMGFEGIGTALSAYRYSGGAWALLTSRTDSAYNTTGNITAYLGGTVVRADDFGGGTVVAGGSALTLDLSDTANAADGAVGYAQGYAITILDNVEPSEVLSRAQGHALAPADSVSPSESLSRVHALRIEPTDSVTPSEVLSLAQALGLSLSDLVNADDGTVGTAFTTTMTLIDNAGASDILLLAEADQHSLIDSAITSDLLTLNVVLPDEPCHPDAVCGTHLCGEAICGTWWACPSPAGLALGGIEPYVEIIEGDIIPRAGLGLGAIAPGLVIDQTLVPPSAGLALGAYLPTVQSSSSVGVPQAGLALGGIVPKSASTTLMLPIVCVELELDPDPEGELVLVAAGGEDLALSPLVCE